MGATINPIARRQILALTESALIKAGVVGMLPTPLDAVDEVAGVQELVDISDLPEDLVVAKPSARRRILGAYLYRSETMFVDLAQPNGRARFIRGHETSHRLIPWHRDSYHLDDDLRLSRETEELLEQETNLGATHILFQGQRFHARALDYENSIRTPVALAPEFGTSLHATIWYYVEHHPEPVALVTAGRYPRPDGSVPIWDSVESSSFLQRFRQFVAVFPGRSIVLGNEGNP